MTISITTNKTGPTAGDNAVTSFNYNFRIDDEDDLVVIHTDPEGVETTLTITTDYTVSGVGGQSGGTITYPVSGSPLPPNQTLTLKRVLSLKQLTNLRNQGGYFPEVQESALDTLLMVMQQLDEETKRSIRVKESKDLTGLDLTLPMTLTASRYLAIDGAGTGLSLLSAPVVDSSVVVVVGGAPSHVEGRIWIDTGTANKLIWKQSDGTDWTTIIEVDTTANVATLVAATIQGIFDDLDGLTLLVAPASNDEIGIRDQSAAAGRRITLSNLFKVVNELAAFTAPVAGDVLPIYDSVGGATKKIGPEDLLKIITSITAETAPATGDEIAIYDVSVSDSRKMTLANMLKVIDQLTAETAPAIGDKLALYDVSGSSTDSITLDNVFKVIDGLTAETVPDKDNDLAVIYDASAAAPRKMKLTNIMKAWEDDGIAGFFPSGQDATSTIYVWIDSPFPFTVESLTHALASGSMTATCAINNGGGYTNITGLSSLTVNTTESSNSATANNTVNAAGSLRITLSGNGSGDTDFRFMFQIKRTG